MDYKFRKNQKVVHVQRRFEGTIDRYPINGTPPNVYEVVEDTPLEQTKTTVKHYNFRYADPKTPNLTNIRSTFIHEDKSTEELMDVKEWEAFYPSQPRSKPSGGLHLKKTLRAVFDMIFRN